ncbi:unnamed protein product [Microthlaspi erraticum]|uniref:Uncharacterized protein n=1 Tax=Microthlaspi erraticum TaxID=1685480 RepID=A0A6D2JYF1_9BRAS|nr:unnamed protein product [Microthlaspi erraticum]
MIHARFREVNKTASASTPVTKPATKKFKIAAGGTFCCEPVNLVKGEGVASEISRTTGRFENQTNKKNKMLQGLITVAVMSKKKKRLTKGNGSKRYLLCGMGFSNLVAGVDAMMLSQRCSLRSHWRLKIHLKWDWLKDLQRLFQRTPVKRVHCYLAWKMEPYVIQEELKEKTHSFWLLRVI